MGLTCIYAFLKARLLALYTQTWWSKLEQPGKSPAFDGRSLPCHTPRIRTGPQTK